jgi:tetratricopeptide (TPR) repeat protein
VIERLRAAAIVVVLATIALAAGVGVERAAPPAAPGEELLYLPNGRHLEVLSLGHSSLVADFLYLWAIQFYANYERDDRFRYVEHVFGDVIGELDPHFIDPYWLGALILTVEAGDLEAGLRLLERGFANNPDEWVFPYLGAWELYRAGDYRRAAEWFERAARVPGAPATVLRMRAGMLGKAGDLERAIALWNEVLADPAADATSRAIAERQIRDLRVRRDVQAIAAAAAAFRKDNGRLPRRLEELVRSSYLDRLPLDPDGRPYAWDASTGRVVSYAGRVLGGA